ncbi:heparinase [Echinicola strongylocentroti]|uniref:Heparinase n=1 Tax=Echinicola strongylocentroti TaxID=1795355 RepID=A0A2Z4ILJ1_9BACT|nr:heparinase II/III family protein [Echinicola strongylocentroti]AWW31597.1 heparinase [Echinicola strongylocentroti]
MKSNVIFTGRGIALCCLLIGVIFGVSAQQKRDLLTKEINQSGDFSSWAMDPQAIFSDRAAVHEQLVQLPKEIQGQLVKEGNKAMEYEWPAIPVSAYMDFVRNGNRTRMQSYQNQRTKALKSLVLAELLVQDGTYLDAIMDGVWAMCEQSTWVLSAHLSAQEDKSGMPDVEEPVIDLGAGEVANLLSWIHFYFRNDFETISPLLARRIKIELEERIISPYLARDDFWWMGFDSSFVNNWNPWCNYNVLLTASLVENDQERLRQVVEKSARSVDQFINYYKADGACEEGPAYWDHAAGKMLEYLELLKTLSKGQVDVGQASVIQNMGNYIREVHIADDYYVNFADASARLKAHPGIIFRYGQYISDERLKGFAADVAQKEDLDQWLLKGSLDRTIHNLMEYRKLESQKAYQEKAPYFWYPETEVAGGRGDDGLFFAAKGGHNNESHNHNDVGTFVLYYQGNPVFIDVGVETYSAKTFSKDRYDIWTMQSDFHNLPQINGVPQQNGNDFKASSVDFSEGKRFIRFGVEISHAYDESAASEFWNRNYELDRKKGAFTIADQFSLDKRVAGSEVHFMSLYRPEKSAEGMVTITLPNGQEMIVHYPADKLSLTIEEWPVEDPRLLQVWEQEVVYRLVFGQVGEQLKDKWEIEVTTP